MITPCIKHSTESQPLSQIHFSLKSHYSRKPLLLCKVIIRELNPLMLITIF